MKDAKKGFDSWFWPIRGNDSTKTTKVPILAQLIVGDLDTDAVNKLAMALANETKTTMRGEIVDATDINRLKFGNGGH